MSQQFYVPDYIFHSIVDIEEYANSLVIEELTALDIPSHVIATINKIQRERVSDLISYLEREHEGPGSIVVLALPGSPCHLGCRKITACKDKAINQRINRLYGEVRTDINIEFEFPVFLRLEFEKLVHKELDTAGFRDIGTKWFSIDSYEAEKIIRKTAEKFLP